MTFILRRWNILSTTNPRCRNLKFVLLQVGRLPLAGRGWMREDFMRYCERWCGRCCLAHLDRAPLAGPLNLGAVRCLSALP